MKHAKPIIDYPSELEKMRYSRDFWRWGFWFLAVACVALAMLVR